MLRWNVNEPKTSARRLTRSVNARRGNASGPKTSAPTRKRSANVLEAERANAIVERERAEKQRERAEAERQRAENERMTADAERERAESERQKAKVEWERAELESQRANHFVEAVSHDLRQPIHAMSQTLATLNLKTKRLQLPELLSDIQIAQQQNKELGKLIQACFDLSRLSARIWDLNVEEVTLPPLIDSIIMEWRVLAADYQVILESAPIPPYILRTDSPALRRILESVRRVQAGLQSFLSMRRIEARRKNASAFRLRFSQSLASLRQLMFVGRWSARRSSDWARPQIR